MKSKKEETQLKKVIKQTLCDTATAEQIGEARFENFTEHLYRTKSGKYFIHGVGGASSRYASRDEDGNPIPGEDIILLTNPAAADWIMDVYGPVGSYYAAKNGAKKDWTKISVASSTKAMIDELRKGTGMTVNELINEALEAYRTAHQ